MLSKLGKWLSFQLIVTKFISAFPQSVYQGGKKLCKQDNGKVLVTKFLTPDYLLPEVRIIPGS